MENEVLRLDVVVCMCQLRCEVSRLSEPDRVVGVGFPMYARWNPTLLLGLALSRGLAFLHIDTPYKKALLVADYVVYHRV